MSAEARRPVPARTVTLRQVLLLLSPCARDTEKQLGPVEKPKHHAELLLPVIPVSELSRVQRRETGLWAGS